MRGCAPLRLTFPIIHFESDLRLFNVTRHEHQASFGPAYPSLACWEKELECLPCLEAHSPSISTNEAALYSYLSTGIRDAATFHESTMGVSFNDFL
jgi:hypothetical protein